MIAAGWLPTAVAAEMDCADRDAPATADCHGESDSRQCLNRWKRHYGIWGPSGILLMSSFLSAADSWAIRASSAISIEAPRGLVPNPVVGAVMKRMSLLRRPLIENASEVMSATEKLLSTLKLLVLASTSLASRTGLVKVALLRYWSANALREASWRRPREMSPRLSWCSSRTNPSAA